MTNNLVFIWVHAWNIPWKFLSFAICVTQRVLQPPPSPPWVSSLCPWPTSQDRKSEDWGEAA
jgi:hypothetical protein